MVYFEGSRIVCNGNKRRTKLKEMEREKMNLSKILCFIAHKRLD